MNYTFCYNKELITPIQEIKSLQHKYNINIKLTLQEC